jgi:hypothetical protein
MCHSSYFIFLHRDYDALASSLMDSTASPKVKIAEGEGEGVGARSLACNTSKVEGHVGAPKWD